MGVDQLVDVDTAAHEHNSTRVSGGTLHVVGLPSALHGTLLV